MHFFALSSLLVSISSLSMAIWVYLEGKTKKINILWTLFAISVALWGFGSYKFTTTLNKTNVFLWLQLTYIGVIFIPTLFCQFVYMFLEIKRKKVNLLLYLLTTIFIMANFGRKSLFLGEPGVIFSSFYWVVSPGPLWYLFIAYFLSVIAHCVYELFRAYTVALGLKRNQIGYFYLATLVGFSSGATCFLPCFGINFYPGIGNLGVFLYCIPMAYAIARYRLMDIRVAITRTGIFIAVYALVLGLPFALSTYGQYFLIKFLGVNWWVAPLTLMGALGIIGPFVYIRLRRSAEAILFREQLRYQKTLRQAAEEMTRILNLKRLSNFIVHALTKTVRIYHAAYYLFDAKSETYVLNSGRNLKTGQPLFIDKNNPLVVWLNDRRKPIVYEEIKRKAEERSKIWPDLKALEQESLLLNAKVAVPSFLEGKLSGIILLGDKRSGKIYSSEDLNIFSFLANQAALAIENASLYNNIEGQVRQRTRELAEVQKQLIQAEKLASVGTLAGGVAHEINNPLTAILTNTQMLLAETKTLDLDAKESLQLIEEATKRCRTIVQKLMAYARKPLESTELSEVDLLSAVHNSVSFLKYQLEQENIKVNIVSNEQSYPVRGNQNELEQVVTNIVLNARDAVKRLKKSGEITIKLSKISEGTRIEIKDDGIGIPKELISKIFDPFFTTKDVGKGLGLGLSICQAIIEKHKGTISVKSAPHQGAIFTIQLPSFFSHP